MSVKGLYPLSSQDGKAIPLDIVKPSNLVVFNFAANISADVVIPSGFNLCWIYATKACILQSGASIPDVPAEGTAYPNAAYIPEGMPLTLVLEPGQISLVGLEEAGTLYINCIEQWAALLQAKQISVG